MLKKRLPLNLKRVVIEVPDNTTHENSPPHSSIEKFEEVMALLTLKITTPDTYTELVESKADYSTNANFKAALDKIKASAYTHLAMGSTPYGTENESSYYHGDVAGINELSASQIIEHDFTDFEVPIKDQLKILSFLAQNQWIFALYLFDDIIDNNKGVIPNSDEKNSVMQSFVAKIVSYIKYPDDTHTKEQIEMFKTQLSELPIPTTETQLSWTEKITIEQKKVDQLFTSLDELFKTLSLFTKVKSSYEPSPSSELKTPHTRYIKLKQPTSAKDLASHSPRLRSSKTYEMCLTPPPSPTTSPASSCTTSPAESPPDLSLSPDYFEKFFENATKYFQSALQENDFAKGQGVYQTQMNENEALGEYLNFRTISGAVRTVVELACSLDPDADLESLKSQNYFMEEVTKYITLSICLHNDAILKELKESFDPSYISIAFSHGITYQKNPVNALADAIEKLLNKLIKYHKSIEYHLDYLSDGFSDPQRLKYLEIWFNLMQSGVELLQKSQRYYSPDDPKKHVLISSKSLEEEEEEELKARIPLFKPSEIPQVVFKKDIEKSSGTFVTSTINTHVVILND